MSSGDGIRPTHTARHKAAHELREFAIISAYLYVCLGAILLYKAAVLNGEGVSYAPYGLAAVKALVLGKFILLGRAAGLGDRYGARRPIYVIVHKALLFLALLLVLSVIEEVVVGFLHHRSAAEVLSTFLGGSWFQVLASSVIMLLVLIPYFAFGELLDALGESRLRRMLLDPRAGRLAGRPE
jgi:hypothetical protein